MATKSQSSEISNPPSQYMRYFNGPFIKEKKFILLLQYEAAINRHSFVKSTNILYWLDCPVLR